MQLHLDGTPWTAAEGDWLIVGATEGFNVAGSLAALDAALGGSISRLREQQDFTGKLAEVVPLRGVMGIKAQRVLLVGLGATDKLDAAALHRALVTAARHVSTKATKRVAVAVPEQGADASTLGRRVESTAAAMLVGCIGQDLYRTERKRFPFEKVHLLVSAGSDVAKLRASLNDGQIVGEAINLTRELVNRPPMEIFPASFAERAEQIAKEVGLNCDVLDEPALVAEKMGSLLAVAAGSDQPPRLVVLEHNAAPAGSPVLALVGKGVTFDSGGLSIKSTENMLTMKCDMAGAATVLATMSAIARLKFPIHVIGLMGLVENMTGGKAMKLGDILTSRAGVTIEVLNTDAEGRLVLADVLDYALTRGADQIIDLATLTGACVVALGEEVVGAMSNSQPWCEKVLAAARAAGEDMWQLPMFDHYNDLIKGDVGDVKNTGGRWGGAITAAKFLEKFVKDKPWVHLDIAGPAFASSDKPHREAGATGCMVRTLIELVRRGA
jgi:leucyl aminopeptidase